MDDDAAKKVADVLNRYRVAKARFYKRDLGALVSAYAIKKGQKVFCDILIEPKASNILAADAADPDFFDAIKGRDDAVEMTADELNMYRKFVLHDQGTFP